MANIAITSTSMTTVDPNTVHCSGGLELGIVVILMFAMDDDIIMKKTNFQSQAISSLVLLFLLLLLISGQVSATK